MENIFNTNLICIPSGSSMADAKLLMKEKRIRHLPVVNHDGRITGMLSSRDMSDIRKLQELPVELFASHPVQCVTVDTPLHTVALKMIEKKISSLLLCNNENKAIGIITTDDLLLELAHLLQKTQPKHNSVTEGEADKKWTEIDYIRTAGEFSRRLSEIGI